LSVKSLWWNVCWRCRYTASAAAPWHATQLHCRLKHINCEAGTSCDYTWHRNIVHDWSYSKSVGQRFAIYLYKCRERALMCVCTISPSSWYEIDDRRSTVDVRSSIDCLNSILHVHSSMDAHSGLPFGQSTFVEYEWKRIPVTGYSMRYSCRRLNQREGERDNVW